MLKIRKEQVETLEKTAWLDFEMEMLAHSKLFSPRLCKVLADEQILAGLRQSIERALKIGFTNRGPIRLYIELMFLCGSDFHNDPVYPGLTRVLYSDKDQMERAQIIYQAMVEYNEKVSGENNINTRSALEYLGQIAYKPIRFDNDQFELQVHRELYRAFPLKVAFSGEDGIRSLIKHGRCVAKLYCFDTPRSQALLVILMFAFGHGCINDPLYPWIKNTLNDQRIINSKERAKRLEKKSLTWLRHVLLTNAEGVRASE